MDDQTTPTPAGVSRRTVVTTAAVGVGGLVVGAAAGWGLKPGSASTGGASASSEPIRIGSMAPLTGPYSGDGQEMFRGAEMAVEEINAGGGVLGRQLELVAGDVSDLAPENYIQAAQRLVSQEGVAATFAGYTTSTSSEFDIFAEAGVPLFHTNTLQANTDYVVENGITSIFQCCPTEIWYASGFISLMQEWIASGQWTPSSNSVAIITSNDSYSISIAEVFRNGIEELGWEVTMFDEVTVPYADWGPQLARIRENPPGLIFITDYLPSDLASFATQFAAAPTQSLLYQQYGPSVPEYLDLAGDAANGVVWSTTIGTLPDRIGTDFRERYRAKYGTEAGLSQSGAQYDMVHLWARAAATAGDPADYARVCEAVKGSLYRGVVGTYAFDQTELTAIPFPDRASDPSLGMPHLTYQIRGGEQVLISPDPYTGGGFELPSWIS